MYLCMILRGGLFLWKRFLFNRIKLVLCFLVFFRIFLKVIKELFFLMMSFLLYLRCMFVVIMILKIFFDDFLGIVIL